MAEEYRANSDRDYERIRDAHTNAHVAKILSALALVASIIALATALSALNKATDALNVANRSLNTTQTQR